MSKPHKYLAVYFALSLCSIVTFWFFTQESSHMQERLAGLIAVLGIVPVVIGWAKSSP